MKKIFTLLLLVTLGTSTLAEEKLAFSFFDKLFKVKKEKTIENQSFTEENLANINNTSIQFKYIDKETKLEKEFFVPLIDIKKGDHRTKEIASIEKIVDSITIREKAVVVLKYYNKIFKEHLEEISDNPKKIYLLGNQYFKNHQYEKARMIFSKNTDIIENLFGAAVTNKFLGNYNNAINYYGEIIYREPNLSEPYLGRGICYRNLGQYREALSDFTKYKSMSNSEESYLALGNIYLLRKDFNKANEILNQGRNLYPNSKLMKELLKKSYINN